MASRAALRTTVGVAVVVGACSVAISADTWKQGRTPDGQPDIQGIWLNFDGTPFEAPDPNAKAAPAEAPGPAADTGPAPEFADHNHKVRARRR